MGQRDTDILEVLFRQRGRDLRREETVETPCPSEAELDQFFRAWVEDPTRAWEKADPGIRRHVEACARCDRRIRETWIQHVSQVIRTAVEPLRAMGITELIGVLMDRDQPAWVRELVVDMLAEVDMPDVEAALQTASRADPDKDVQAAARAGLQRLRTRRRTFVGALAALMPSLMAQGILQPIVETVQSIGDSWLRAETLMAFTIAEEREGSPWTAPLREALLREPQYSALRLTYQGIRPAGLERTLQAVVQELQKETAQWRSTLMEVETLLGTGHPEQALDVARAIEARLLRARVLMDVAVAYRRAGAIDKAEATLAEALEALRTAPPIRTSRLPL